jgi:hypothetical protein
LRPGEREPRRPRPACHEGARTAAEAEADQEHRQDDRERVDRCAEQQAEQTRPDHLGGQRAEARAGDDDEHRARTSALRDLTRRGRRRARARPDPRGDAQRTSRHRRIDRRRNVGRNRHVVDAEQVETGKQASEHGSGDVAGVEQAEHRHPAPVRFDRARDRRQRRAHRERRRQQADRRDERPQRDAAGAAPARIERRHRRHHRQQQDAGGADRDLQQRVDTQRMETSVDQPRRDEAAEAHPAHEHAEQHADRHGRRADHQLEQLLPHRFVNQRGGAAPGKQQKD